MYAAGRKMQNYLTKLRIKSILGFVTGFPALFEQYVKNIRIFWE